MKVTNKSYEISLSFETASELDQFKDILDIMIRGKLNLNKVMAEMHGIKEEEYYCRDSYIRNIARKILYSL